MLCMNPDGAETIYDMYFKSSWLTDHNARLWLMQLVKNRHAVMQCGNLLILAV